MPAAEPIEGQDLPRGARNASEGILQAALRIPLYWKILFAHAAILAAGVAAAVLLVQGYPQLRTLPMVGVLVVSVTVVLAVGAAVSALLVRLALRPLWQLQDAAEKVRTGDLGTRAPASPVADRRLLELIGTFNGMLERLARERERRRRLAVQALRAEDRVRRQIAGLLQEETAQRQAAHVLQLRRIQDATSEEQRDRLLSTAREQAVATLESVRRTARGLHPPELEDLGIAAALRAFARTASASSAEVEVRSERLMDALPKEQRVGLYRILREALSNALLHSDASHVLVRIGRDDTEVRGEVVDDGRGFDPEAVERDAETGLGLMAMRELSVDLGGVLEVETALGEGTRLRVSLPVTEGRAGPADDGA